MPQRFHQVVIAGEPYRFRMGITPLKDAQKLTGKTAGQLFSGLLSFDVECMGALLWAARRTADPTVKYAETDELLQAWIDSGADLEDISAELFAAADVSGVLRRNKAPEGGDEGPGAEGDDGEDPKAESPSTSG